MHGDEGSRDAQLGLVGVKVLEAQPHGAHEPGEEAELAKDHDEDLGEAALGAGVEAAREDGKYDENKGPLRGLLEPTLMLEVKFPDWFAQALQELPEDQRYYHNEGQFRVDLSNVDVADGAEVAQDKRGG